MKTIAVILSLLLISSSLPAQKSEKNGWSVGEYDESMARSYLDGTMFYLEPIEGIWQSTDGFKYLIQYTNDQYGIYRMLVIESSSSQWGGGDVKAFISDGSNDGIYSMKYFTQDAWGRTSSQTLFLIAGSPKTLKFTRIDNNEEILLYRLYPDVPSVAGSYVSSDAKSWSGSSVAIGKRYVATNYHVVEDAKTLVITGVSGHADTEYTAEAVASDKYNDLAILKITDSRFPGFTNIGYGCKTSTVDVGNSVFVLGYPLTGTMGEEIKLTTGVISSKTGFMGDVSQYQISAAVQPGNSGGPLFDDRGNLIGIVSAKHAGAENVGYAIKLSYLKSLIESTNEPISLPTNNTIASYSLPEKIKAVSPCVSIVKASDGKSCSGGGGKLLSLDDLRQARDNLGYAEQVYYNQHFEKYFEAYECVAKSIEIYPTPKSHFLRGLFARIFNFHEEAKEDFQYCVDNNYRPTWSYAYLALAYYKLNDTTTALSILDKALAVNNRNIEALIYRGQIMADTGKTDEALSDLKQAVKFEGQIEHNYSSMYNTMAYWCLEKCDTTTACRYAEEALKRAPMNGNIWDTNGEMKYMTGNYDECITHMNNAIAIGSLSNASYLSNSYYYRGLARVETGNIADGYRDLVRARHMGLKEEQVAHAAERLQQIDLTMDITGIKINETSGYSYKYEYPKVKKQSKGNLKIMSIDVTNEKTVLHLKYQNLEYDNGRYSIDPATYIHDPNTGKTYKLLSADNCAVLPQHTSIEKGFAAEFSLIFPAIPETCRQINFIESSESSWNMYGIALDLQPLSNSETLRFYCRPTVENSGDIDICAVEVTDKYTFLYVAYVATRISEDGIPCDKNAFIRDTNSGKQYKACGSTPPIKCGETQYFTLMFPTIPGTCEKIDFVETDNSSWNTSGITLE